MLASTTLLFTGLQYVQNSTVQWGANHCITGRNRETVRYSSTRTAPLSLISLPPSDSSAVLVQRCGQRRAFRHGYGTVWHFAMTLHCTMTMHCSALCYYNLPHYDAALHIALWHCTAYCTLKLNCILLFDTTLHIALWSCTAYYFMTLHCIL